MTETQVPVSRPSPPVDIAFAAVVLATIVRAAAVPVLRITDAPLHLLTGRVIVERGAIPRTDPFTYTGEGTTWVVQQWLADAVFAVVERVGGVAGLSLLLATLVGVAVGLLAWEVRRSAPTFWGVVVVALAAFAGAGNWTLRGNVFSFVLFLLTYRLVRGRSHPLLALPLFALWANLHGAALLGLGLLGLAAGVATLARVAGRDSALDPARLWTATAAAAVGTLITPWGWRLYTYALDIAREAPSFVSEWARPSLTRWDVRALAVLGLVTAVALVVAARRRDDGLALDAPLALVFGALGASALRHGTVAALVLALVAARHPLRSPAPLDQVRGWSPLDRALAATLVVAAVVPMAILVARADPFGGRYPLRTAAALQSDRVWAEQGWTTGILLLRWPDVRTNIDGRVEIHGREGFEEYLRVRDALDGWEAWLDEHCVGEVVAEPDRPIVAALLADDGWREVSTEDVDTGTAVLLRRRGPAC